MYRHPRGHDNGYKPPPVSYPASQWAPPPPNPFAAFPGYAYGGFPPPPPPPQSGHHYPYAMDDDDDSSSSEYTTTTKQVQRQKRSRDMNISVKFSPEQYVQIRLGSESSWITALVLSVLEVAEKRWGFEYKVSYEVKKRGWVTTTIPGNSANIRAFPGL